MPARKKVILIFVELGLWAAFILTMFWLWDRWLIPGPHGTIHWVGMDFVPYWVGVRAMLTGQSPYSTGTTHLIQTVLLGGPPEAGGDPMLFVYPAWIFLLLAPWALLPLKWAVALWTGSLLLGIIHLIGYLAFRWGGHRIGRTGFWAVVLVVGCLPFLSIAVMKGQLNLVSLGALFLAIRLVGGLPMQRGSRIPSSNHRETKSARAIFREIMAGIFLALSILKPTLTILAMAGMLLWALVERRVYLIAGFASCIGVLSLASWFAVGNWIPDYLQLLINTGGAPVLWSLALLAWPWKALYAFLFTGIGAYAFIYFLRTRNRTQWFSAAILAGLALFPMRWIYDLLLGILVPAEAEQMSRLSAASVVIALLAPWGLALFPEPLRWSAQVIGLPLAWAFVWFAHFVLPVRSKGMK
ncbi:MAG: DUF2029 domain-containing protein [Chloroflexi bacterium]|nr:DUF2029 domain-containing protein [Chloroflexota bacterium]